MAPAALPGVSITISATAMRIVRGPARRADARGSRPPAAILGCVDSGDDEVETSALSVTGTVILTCAFLSLTALAGATLVSVALAVVMVVVAWGWAGTLGLPAPRGTVGVLLLGGVAILLSVSLPGGSASLSWLPGALAIAMMSAFLHQLLRRDGRPRVVESVSSVLLALTLFTCAAFLVPLSRTTEGVLLVAAAMVAAALSAVVATAMRRLPAAWTPWVVPTALLLGGGGAAVVGAWGGYAWTAYAAIGVLTAAVSHATRTIFSVLPTMAHRRPRAVVALCSVLVVGVVPYVVAVGVAPGALPV